MQTYFKALFTSFLDLTFLYLFNIQNLREAKYAKNHFQQNRYSILESHVMRKESLSTKILRSHGKGEVVQGLV